MAEPLKIFVSWSKEQSRRVALILSEILRESLDNVEVFHSQKGIKPGQRSMKVIEKELEGTRFGVAVVTQQNQEERWLNFEVGAMSKSVGSDEQGIPRVVPVLVDFPNENDLTGPISQFQFVHLGHEGLKSLITSVCEVSGQEKEVALTRFERAWRDREQEVREASRPDGEDSPLYRPESDKIDEILELLRTIQRGAPINTRDIVDALYARELQRDENYRIRSTELVERLAEPLGATVKGAGHIHEYLVELHLRVPANFPEEEFAESVRQAIGYQVVLVTSPLDPEEDPHHGGDQAGG